MKELFMRFPDFKTRAFTMSYDDGTVYDKEMVRILDSFGLKCTFNLNSGKIGRENYLSENEVKTLYANHEIAVHTVNHPHLDNLDNASVLQEIIRDRENLEGIFGRIIKGMAYPFCLNSERVLNCVRTTGINYARTVEDTRKFALPDDFLRWNPTCHHIDGELGSLIEKFFERDDIEHPWRIETKVFYLWGHSYEFAGKFNVLEDICKKVAEKDNVWYATNGEIFGYVDRYKKLEFSANGKIIYNPTDIDIFAFCDNKNLLIPAGKTVIIE